MDAAGVKKYVKKKSRKELEDLIVECRTNAFPVKDATIGKLYKEWIKNKKYEVSYSTIVKYDACWKKYFENGSLARKRIDRITALELRNELILISREFSLTTRKCKEMKSIINQIYDHAVLKRRAFASRKSVLSCLTKTIIQPIWLYS